MDKIILVFIFGYYFLKEITNYIVRLNYGNVKELKFFLVAKLLHK